MSEDAAVRAAESVVTPVGWHEAEIRQYLDGMSDETLVGFVDGPV